MDTVSVMFLVILAEHSAAWHGMAFNGMGSYTISVQVLLQCGGRSTSVSEQMARSALSFPFEVIMHLIVILMFMRLISFNTLRMLSHIPTPQ